MKLDTRWLEWQPSTEKFEKSAEREPSKVSKTIIGISDGARPAQSQNFLPTEGEKDSYQDAFDRWAHKRCLFRDRAYGGVGALHSDYAVWCDRVGREVPAGLRIFKTLLRDSGFTLTDDGLVCGLILAEDLRLPITR